MKPLDESRSRNPTFQTRLILVYLVAVLWAATILSRLVWLQGFRHDHYQELARNQQQGYNELAGHRGEILDRNLSELAISVQVDSLTADPTLIEDPGQTAAVLASPLGVDEETLREDLSKSSRFVRLASKLLPSQAAQIRALDLKGIYFEDVSTRFYPGQQLAASLLGFVGADDEGLAGLEYLYNEEVQGRKQRVYYGFDGRRRRIEQVSEDLENGGDVLVLNLDRSIQFIVERTLAETVERSQAANGAVVVMDPSNGEILAMASWPTFDPNRFSEYDNNDFRNRGILKIYEPGSTFKIITLSAVLNEGLSTLDEVIDCRVGTLRLAGKVYHEAEHSYQDLSLREIIAKSSNVGTIKLALRLGEEKFYEYIRRFGFGKETGVDLPGEQKGLLRDVSQWSKISIGAHAIGQELGVTPLQLVRAVSVVANGGYLVEPHIVRRIHSASGDLIREVKPRRTRILKESTTRLMKEALELVVEEGTGSRARLDGYSSGGKTGTAQKFINGHYSKTRYVASYVGFAPLKNPRLATVVVIDEPSRGLYWGGYVAGPAFKQIMEESLLYLNVPRDEPDPVFQLAGTSSSELPPAQGVPVEADSPLRQEQLEETVLSLLDAKPKVSDSGVITLETGLTTVPDFTGKSLRDVVREGANRGLRLRYTGTGTAVAQRPEAGSRVKPGAVCEVFFSSKGADEIASTTTPSESASPAHRRNR